MSEPTSDSTPLHDALAVYLVAMGDLIEALGLDMQTIHNLSLNFDGREMRVDVARLNAAGHLQTIVASFAANPHDARTFATALPIRVPMPMMPTTGRV